MRMRIEEMYRGKPDIPASPYDSAPGMGNNLVVKVHYRLGSRNC